MSIYKKIQTIEKNVVSLKGDKASNGDKAIKKNWYVTLEKMERTLTEQFEKYNLFFKREVTKSTSNMQPYQEINDKTTSTKIMYFSDVEMTFTFIDTTTGEELEYKFCGSDNKNTNAGQAYGGAVRYARRNFYKVVFNIETSDKDVINSENIEDVTVVPEVKKPTFYNIDGPQNKKQVYDNGVYRELTEDEQPIKEIHLRTLKSEANKKYKERDNEVLKLLTRRCKVNSLEELPLKVFKDLCVMKFDIEDYKKIEKAI